MERARITVFDTTLRDGEQSPGCSMNVQEKLRLAHQLDRLGVDVIEAGFPIASEGDFAAVQAIAAPSGGPSSPGLARACAPDIERAWQAAKGTARPRIHVFLATSDIHLQYKLKISQRAVPGNARRPVRLAQIVMRDVEFSPEDASRTEHEFLYKSAMPWSKAGATTLNIPDTVGYAVPEEYGALIQRLYESVPDFQKGKAVISAHCHNDLGLAVANSLAAVRAGARQVECTVNGIGERAGNAALEEIVMGIRTRSDYFGGFTCGVNTLEIVKASRLVARMSSLMVQRNKAIVGANAFAHRSGIHQDGMLKNRGPTKS